jgi:hypothetical protein
MRLALLFLVACGSVSGQQPTIDAAPEIDAPSCGPTDQVDSCGATCEKCTATGARIVPTCDGTACGTGCAAMAPKCNDNSCSQLVFDFEDNTTEGITGQGGLAVMVGVQSGSKALEIPATFGSASLFIDIPVCLSGAIDLSTLTLSVTMFYEDPGAPTGGQYFFQPWAPNKAAGGGANFGTASVEANKPQPFTFALSKSTMSNNTPTIEFEFGTFGAAFTGTVWFDDIKIQ